MHKYISIICIVYILNFALICCEFLKNMDNIHADIHYIRICKEYEINKLGMHLSITKFNRTHIAFGMNMSLKENFDDTFEFSGELRVWKDGGWKHNFMKLSRNKACSTLYVVFGPVWAAVTIAAHAKIGCPVVPGYYYFDNFYADPSTVPFIIQEGRFYGITFVSKNNEIYTCVEVEAEVTKHY